MKLPNAQTNGKTVGAYEQMLKDQGYRRLSFGSFANVYARGNEDHVIKVGNDVNNDGYLQFLALVGLRTKNPHFPRIETLEIFDNEPGNPYSVPYYVVRMERLNEKPQSRTLALREAGLKDVYDLCEPENVTARTRAMLKVKETLTRLFKTHARDIKGDNVMYRGNTLVVTDPVACAEGV